MNERYQVGCITINNIDFEVVVDKDKEERLDTFEVVEMLNNPDIEKFSTQELQAEIERRERSTPPRMLDKPDLRRLKYTLQEYMDFVFSDEYYSDNDYRHYIYEDALKAFYGEDIFDEINKRENELFT